MTDFKSFKSIRARMFTGERGVFARYPDQKYEDGTRRFQPIGIKFKYEAAPGYVRHFSAWRDVYTGEPFYACSDSGYVEDVTFCSSFAKWRKAIREYSSRRIE